MAISACMCVFVCQCTCIWHCGVCRYKYNTLCAVRARTRANWFFGGVHLTLSTVPPVRQHTHAHVNTVNYANYTTNLSVRVCLRVVCAARFLSASSALTDGRSISRPGDNNSKTRVRAREINEICTEPAHAANSQPL